METIWKHQKKDFQRYQPSSFGGPSPFIDLKNFSEITLFMRKS
jgi:hypothetical protein